MLKVSYAQPYDDSPMLAIVKKLMALKTEFILGALSFAIKMTIMGMLIMTRMKKRQVMAFKCYRYRVEPSPIWMAGV